MNICGSCALAPIATEGTAFSHGRCKIATCTCAVNGHRINAAIAGQMAVFCHLTPEEVYRRHDRKRRTLSDEHRASALAQLARARDRKEELRASQSTGATV